MCDEAWFSMVEEAGGELVEGKDDEDDEEGRRTLWWQVSLYRLFFKVGLNGS